MSAIAQFDARGEGLADLALLSAAVAACPESLAVIESGRILYANRAFAQMFGYHYRAEVEGRALSDFVPPGRACTRLSPQTADASPESECGYPACEFTSTRPDGTRIRVQSCCASFRAEDRTLLILSARDISHGERRRLVRESDKRFRAIFDAAAMGIVQCTTEGRVVETNPAVERMLGYTHAELRGMHFRDFTYPDDLAGDVELFEEMVSGKRDYYQIEIRYLRKDGGSGWVRLTVSLVRGPDGNPEFTIGMVEDITERKQAEQQLREAQKMEAIGRLVGGVAHDFNNLLTGIMLYCDLLLAGLDPNGRLRHHVEEIRMAGEHGGALIQQLLAVARQQVVEPRVLSLNQVISGMRNLLSRLIGENIELVTDLSADLWSAKMDPAQVQQIILNLVLNARDAMPDGGRVTLQTLNCTEPNQSGDLQDRDLTPCIELMVTDTGCGMDAGTRSHLFEPFFTTKQTGRGNGLGLATVHGIVKQSGGTIAVESELGQGTRVVICLPRVPAECETTPIALSTSALKGHETVLLVEDDSAVRNAARRVLTQCGYCVLEAANGTEALKVCHNHPGNIDVLVVDLVMPGMSGREVARRLRLARPNLRALYMSGYNQTERNSDPETIVLFRKPFTGSALAQKLREVLEQPTPPVRMTDPIPQKRDES
ncbi:MAG: PAS domain S-box protein [Acidobacteriia bacterium]|nr:PAS domain S-box protein [Terriglobia bacterium]